jgi:hypothetical protein
VALAECCFAGDIGVELTTQIDITLDESWGPLVVGCGTERLAHVLQRAHEAAVQATVIGTAGGDRLLGESLSELRKAWDGE